jgi:hypothetical protein
MGGVCILRILHCKLIRSGRITQRRSRNLANKKPTFGHKLIELTEQGRDISIITSAGNRMAHRNDAQPIGSSSSLERTQQVQRVQQETDLGNDPDQRSQ